MADSTLAGVITACASVLTALGLLVTAVTVLIPILRQGKKHAVELEKVHTIVNQQRTDGQNYQRALIRALEAKGIEVPIDQSVAPDSIGPVPKID